MATKTLKFKMRATWHDGTTNLVKLETGSPADVMFIARGYLFASMAYKVRGMFEDGTFICEFKDKSQLDRASVKRL